MIDDSNDENKTFLVTAKFKMSGVLSPIVTKEHVESNIKYDLGEALGDIVLKYVKNHSVNIVEKDTPILELKFMMMVHPGVLIVSYLVVMQSMSYRKRN